MTSLYSHDLFKSAAGYSLPSDQGKDASAAAAARRASASRDFQERARQSKSEASGTEAAKTPAAKPAPAVVWSSDAKGLPTARLEGVPADWASRYPVATDAEQLDMIAGLGLGDWPVVAAAGRGGQGFAE